MFLKNKVEMTTNKMLERESKFTFLYTDTKGITRNARTDTNILKAENLTEMIGCTYELIQARKYTTHYEDVETSPEITKAVLDSVKYDGMCVDIAKTISSYVTRFALDNVMFDKKKEGAKDLFETDTNLILVSSFQLPIWKEIANKKYPNLKVKCCTSEKKPFVTKIKILKGKTYDRYDAIVMTTEHFLKVYGVEIKKSNPYTIKYESKKSNDLVWERFIVSDSPDLILNRDSWFPMPKAKRSWILTSNLSSLFHPSCELSSIPWLSGYKYYRKAKTQKLDCMVLNSNINSDYEVFLDMKRFKGTFEKQGRDYMKFMTKHSAYSYYEADKFDDLYEKRKERRVLKPNLDEYAKIEAEEIMKKYKKSKLEYIISWIKKNKDKKVLIYSCSTQLYKYLMEKDINPLFYHRGVKKGNLSSNVVLSVTFSNKKEFADVDQVFITTRLNYFCLGKEIIKPLCSGLRKKDLGIEFLCYKHQISSATNVLNLFDDDEPF